MLPAEQANTNTIPKRPVAAVEVTYGELVKGDSGGVSAQSVRDCQSHLVLHRREELEVSDVTPVFGKGVLLADHLFCAMSGKQRQEELLPTEQCLGEDALPQLAGGEAEGAALCARSAHGPCAPAVAKGLLSSCQGIFQVHVSDGLS